MKPNAHLLIIRLSALGDVAMTIPVLRAFSAAYPNVRISFLSKPFLKPMFSELPNIQFIAADVKGEHRGIWGLFKLFFQLKAMNLDAVLDVHNVLRSIFLRNLFRCSFVKVATIDKGRKEKRALTRPKNKIFRQLKSTHERYSDVFRKLGYSFDLSHPVFTEKKKLTPNIIKHTGEKETQWIGIAPFAQYNSKMYPLEKMKTVIKELARNQDIRIFLFGGGAKEVEVLTAISNQNEHTVCMAGKLGLDEELLLISHLDVMLSMDSGNGHFAAMYGVPTITIWGVTHPYTGFAPFQQPDNHALTPDLTRFPLIPCSIYGNKVYE